MMAGFGDCREYDAAQAAGCQCMAPEKAVARREKLLADFYKKHAPSDVGKVAGLAAKAGANAQKFAALLSKLVAKYPKVKKRPWPGLREEQEWGGVVVRVIARAPLFYGVRTSTFSVSIRPALANRNITAWEI